MSKSVPANETKAELQNLFIFTTYEITVAAATKNFTGKMSLPINETTKEGGKIY